MCALDSPKNCSEEQSEHVLHCLLCHLHLLELLFGVIQKKR